MYSGNLNELLFPLERLAESQTAPALPLESLAVTMYESSLPLGRAAETFINETIRWSISQKAKFLLAGSYGDNYRVIIIAGARRGKVLHTTVSAKTGTTTKETKNAVRNRTATFCK